MVSLKRKLIQSLEKKLIKPFYKTMETNKKKTINKLDDLMEQFCLIYGELKYLEDLGDDISYLINESGKNYHIVLKSNSFLDRALDSFLSNFANKFCALLDTDKKVKNTVLKFIRRLLIERSNSNWKNYITKEELQGYEEKIESIQNSTYYKIMVDLRNKKYAHLDYNRIQKDSSLLHKEVKSMLIEVLEIVKVINKKLFRINFSEELLRVGKGRHILEDVSSIFEIKDLIRKKTDSEQISKSELRNIIDKNRIQNSFATVTK